MPSPFPGMDPYLEVPATWQGFHHRLADEIADRLNVSIGPKYYADLEIYAPIRTEEVRVTLPKLPTRMRRWSSRLLAALSPL